MSDSSVEKFQSELTEGEAIDHVLEPGEDELLPLMLSCLVLEFNRRQLTTTREVNDEG